LPISGAARFDAEHVLFVHDAKAVLHEDLPRLTVAKADRPGVFTTIDFPVKGDSPNDLESICAVPGKTNEFLIAESGYHRTEGATADKYGRLFWVEIRKPEATGKWTVRVLKTFTWPAGTVDIEGTALVKTPLGYLLIAGRRDGLLSFFEFGDEDQNLRAAKVDDISLLDLKLAARFNRKVADLYLDANRNLWSVAANEIEVGAPGEGFGPFRSMVYNLGRLIRADGTVRKISESGAYAKVEGFKIEALTSGRKAGEFLFGTDDESMGGTWRYLELK
jgi:hypothetical protein